MYYRKYFEGDVGGATSETKVVTFGACTTKYTVYVNQSRVIGHAVEEVLRDAGMNAYYDDEAFILYPDRDEGWAIREGRESRVSKERCYHVLEIEEKMVESNEKNGVFCTVESTCTCSMPLSIPGDTEESSLLVPECYYSQSAKG